MNLRKTIFTLLAAAFLISIYQNILALRDGIVGWTKKTHDPQLQGCICHGTDPSTGVFVGISGPSSVEANDTAIYYVKIANGPKQAGGCDISTSLGDVITSALDTSLRTEKSNFEPFGFELTHKYPKLFVNDTLTFIFKYIAPGIPNVTDTIFANGNSANHDTSSFGDEWNFANNFLVSVTPKVGIAGNSSIAKGFELQQNYPNPFNPETIINFNISKSSNISLQIFDATGRSIADLINNKFYNSGNYSVTFNAGQYGLTSGVYFYKLSSNSVSELKKMILVK